MIARLATAAVAALLAAPGCSSPDPAGRISYPTNSETPVLWIETKGGGPILPRSFTAANFPTFVLFTTRTTRTICW